MAFDLTPEPPRIGPSRYDVSDYVECAESLNPFSHRHGGTLSASREDAIWVLNHLRAQGFQLVRTDDAPEDPLLRAAIEACDVVDLPPIGALRGLVQICAHEVIEVDGGVRFIPWQLKVEPRVHPSERRWSYEKNPDEPIYKGRSMYRYSRVLGDFLLVAGEGLSADA